MWGEMGHDWCGFYHDGETAEDVLLGDKQAVWRLVPLEDNLFLVQSAARDEGKWECLGFSQQGAATNPSRVDFGNPDPDGGEDTYCGGYNLDGHEDPVQGMIANKQAVWILKRLGKEGEQNEMTKFLPGSGDQVAKENGAETTRRVTAMKAEVAAKEEADVYKRQLGEAKDEGAQRRLRVRGIEKHA